MNKQIDKKIIFGIIKIVVVAVVYNIINKVLFMASARYGGLIYLLNTALQIATIVISIILLINLYKSVLPHMIKSKFLQIVRGFIKFRPYSKFALFIHNLIIIVLSYMIASYLTAMFDFKSILFFLIALVIEMLYYCSRNTCLECGNDDFTIVEKNIKEEIPGERVYTKTYIRTEFKDEKEYDVTCNVDIEEKYVTIKTHNKYKCSKCGKEYDIMMNTKEKRLSRNNVSGSERVINREERAEDTRNNVSKDNNSNVKRFPEGTVIGWRNDAFGSRVLWRLDTKIGIGSYELIGISYDDLRNNKAQLYVGDRRLGVENMHELPSNPANLKASAWRY